MNTLLTQQLLERLATLLRGERRNLLQKHGLQPIQLEALHYVSQCNGYSDTPMAVTEFLGQTKGSVSQTIKVLEKKALLVKTTDSRDKRITHLSLSKQGRQLIKEMFPSPLLTSARRSLGATAFTSIEGSLTSLLSELQKTNQFKTFGQCLACRFNIKAGGGKYVCGLTKEPLTTHDVKLICREHQVVEAKQRD